jgi:hypothetical protein
MPGGFARSADEVDAIGAKRYESQSGGEREIQRTMLELLNQMDGFDARGDVKARRPVCFGARHIFCARPFSGTRVWHPAGV